MPKALPVLQTNAHHCSGGLQGVLQAKIPDPPITRTCGSPVVGEKGVRAYG